MKEVHLQRALTCNREQPQVVSDLCHASLLIRYTNVFCTLSRRHQLRNSLLDEFGGLFLLSLALLILNSGAYFNEGIV